MMNSREQLTIWSAWAARLQAWGLHDLAAVLLESAGPLKLLSAQLVYLGQPALQGLLPGDQLNALAGLLENEHDSRRFVAVLRQEQP